MVKARLFTLVSLIAAAVASRLVPHPWNLTSVAAVALFAGASLEDRRLAFAVPLLALLISDAALGFYKGMAFTYLAYALIVTLGLWLSRHRRPLAPQTRFCSTRSPSSKARKLNICRKISVLSMLLLPAKIWRVSMKSRSKKPLPAPVIPSGRCRWSISKCDY